MFLRALRTLTAVLPNLRLRTLLVGSVSRAYAMTIWRVGWRCGPAALIAFIMAVKSQNCTQTSTLGQTAAVAALDGPQEVLAERCATYRDRHNAALALRLSFATDQATLVEGYRRLAAALGIPAGVGGS